MATLEEVNYTSVVNALIARFDSEVSVEKHHETISNMKLVDRYVYYELSAILGKKSIEAQITTVDSRNAKKFIEQINKLSGD